MAALEMESWRRCRLHLISISSRTECPMQDMMPEAKALTQAIVARLEAAPQLVGLDI